MLEHSKIVPLLQFGFHDSWLFFVLLHIMWFVWYETFKEPVMARFLLLIFYF
jgi:hypothetical protein